MNRYKIFSRLSNKILKCEIWIISISISSITTRRVVDRSGSLSTSSVAERGVGPILLCEGGRGAKGGRGGKGVAFSLREVNYLREGYRLFASKAAKAQPRGTKSRAAYAGEAGRGGAAAESWVRLAMARFSFHPSRTEKSLKDKWYTMHK